MHDKRPFDPNKVKGFARVGYPILVCTPIKIALFRIGMLYPCRQETLMYR